MANERNGRNAAASEDAPTSWRPQDENGERDWEWDWERRRGGERETDRRAAHWTDRDDLGPSNTELRYDDRGARGWQEDWHRDHRAGPSYSWDPVYERTIDPRFERSPGPHPSDRHECTFDPRVDRERRFEPRVERERRFDPRVERDRRLEPRSVATGYGESRGTGYVGSGIHRGKGPIGYTRSDERVREIVCDLLTDHGDIDASHIEVTVQHGEVTLAGSVSERHTKRLAEDVIEAVTGVNQVINQLRVGEPVEHQIAKADQRMANAAAALRAQPTGSIDKSADTASSAQGNGNDKRHRA